MKRPITVLGLLGAMSLGFAGSGCSDAPAVPPPGAGEATRSRRDEISKRMSNPPGMEGPAKGKVKKKK